jgi:alkanesulfonate monooxygenase SsuD/methylene tetrahydromethanopterin reductase-like flavin-dependent oxidoreductase (luciferase family)
VPAHDIGIWLGAYGPRMVRLTGRLADGWIPSLPRMPLGDVPARQEAIDEAARRAGRDPAAVRRVANVSPQDGFLDGPLEEQVEQLVGLVREARFQAFVFSLGEDPAREIERLAGEVAPAVRSALGEA